MGFFAASFAMVERIDPKRRIGIEKRREEKRREENRIESNRIRLT